MKNDFMIVSVESRKGGVGKTTGALNLARILLERRKHAVLFLDVDITGTNVTDCLDSPFWRDICHGVQDATKGEPHVANLLAIFQRQFMPGLARPSFIREGAEDISTRAGSLAFISDKINIIGSQIYDLEVSSPDKRGDTCVCKPSILFDELHAFWFIEFLQRICETFMEAIKKDEPERPVAVIVDNSPGYIGIAPAVQEWLTDIGPDRGKFLTVSSLDKQDLISCGHAIHNLHRLYGCKWHTSRKLTDATSKNTESHKDLQLTRDEEGFFLRLVEAQSTRRMTHKSHGRTFSVGGDHLSFYGTQDAKTGEAYLNHPERYQGLIVNRVPRFLKRGVYAYDKEQMYAIMHHGGSSVVQDLLGDDRSGYTHWMVSYDEAIEYQFLQPMISRRFSRMSRRNERRDRLMCGIKERYPLPPEDVLEATLHHQMKEMHRKMIEEVWMYLRKIHESVTAVIGFVEQTGFSHLTHLVHEEWLPGNILRDFNVAMQDVLLEMGGPFIEFAPWELGDETLGGEAWMFVGELCHRMEHRMKECDLPVSFESTGQFLPSLKVLMALSMGRRRWHPEVSHEIPDLFAGIASIEALHWERYRKRSKERMPIQRFLAAEDLTEKEWSEFPDVLRGHPQWFERGVLPRLYRACASAQARLIDVRRDAQFLIELVERLIMEDTRDSPVLPYIRGIADEVIVRKTLSHESGLRTVAKGFSSAQYMEEFSEVLERILARWEDRS